MSDKEETTGQLSKNLDIEAAIKASEGSGELYRKLKGGLGNIGSSFIAGFKKSLMGEAELDEDLFDEIEEKLLISDMGTHTARQIIGYLQDEFEAGKIRNKDHAFKIIRSILEGILLKNEGDIDMDRRGPTVIMFVGINGSGKTTTIGKIAKRYKDQGNKTLIAAGDTFRAAAIDQLKVWADRSDCDFYAKESGSDPSATMFEASQKAVDENYDLLICDTSGRLHTKKNLMDELIKMKRVISKNIPDGPHYTILTLDSTGGQNAVRQAQAFKEQIGYDGLALTKLDGTSKGGVVFGIVNEYAVPVYYVGMGESIDDVFEFEAKSFIKGFLG